MDGIDSMDWFAGMDPEIGLPDIKDDLDRPGPGRSGGEEFEVENRDCRIGRSQ
jgi:hypothetical protein